MNLIEVGFKLVDGDWPAEQVALEKGATGIAQEAALLLRLHSFGDYCQVEAVRHGDYCCCNRRIIWVGGYLPDK